LAVAGMFIILLILFLAYDHIIDTRNNKIVGAASHSNTILSKMFPNTVRDRLLQEKEVEQESAKRRKSIKLSDSNHGDQDRGTLRRSSFNLNNIINEAMKGIHEDILDASTSSNHDINVTAPIADLFPNATVFYGDIVGTFFGGIIKMG
jgi:hypothetical protein